MIHLQNSQHRSARSDQSPAQTCWESNLG